MPLSLVVRKHREPGVEIHRSILVGGFGVLGIWASIELYLDVPSILAIQQQFFAGSSLFAYGSAAAAFLAPLSCLLLALAAYRIWRNWSLLLPLVHISLVLFPAGLVASSYFLWWWYATREAGAS